MLGSRLSDLSEAIATQGSSSLYDIERGRLDLLLRACLGGLSVLLWHAYD
jgi:hypothetical protein